MCIWVRKISRFAVLQAKHSYIKGTLRSFYFEEAAFDCKRQWGNFSSNFLQLRKETPTLLLKSCALRAMAMPHRPVGLHMKLSEPKFNFQMVVYFRGDLFPWGLFSVEVYCSDPLEGGGTIYSTGFFFVP